MARYKANASRLIQIVVAAVVTFIILELLGVFHPVS